MKKILTPILFILLLSAFSVQAQTDQLAPTKEDALNFVKTVVTSALQFPLFCTCKSKIIEIRLDGCMLSVRTQELSTVFGSSSEQSYNFDLSKVKAVLRKYEHDAVGGGPFTSLDIEELSKNAVFMQEGTNKPEFDTFPFIDDHENPIFKGNNYVERLFKALDFLIKSCGGGRIKVDPNSKF